MAYAKGRRIAVLGAFAFTVTAEAFYPAMFDFKMAIIC